MEEMTPCPECARLRVEIDRKDQAHIARVDENLALAETIAGLRAHNTALAAECGRLRARVAELEAELAIDAEDARRARGVLS